MINTENKNPKKRTFLGNLWRGIVKNNIPLGDTLVNIIDGGNPSQIIDAVKKDPILTPEQKEILFAEMEKDTKEKEMYYEEMNSARTMYQKGKNEVSDFVAKRVINYNLWVVFGAILVEIFSVMYIDDKVLIAIISGAIGSLTTALLQERQQIINFFFGSSQASKDHNDASVAKKLGGLTK